MPDFSMKQLSILFAGESTSATYIDGTTETVFVRTLPQRLLGSLLAVCEIKHALIELCTYIALEAAADPLCPAGKQPVPVGWSDNLTDEAADQIYEIAQRLNFQRAAKWARGQIAAKKMIAPIQELAVQQVLPLVEGLIAPIARQLSDLRSSMPSAPSSSAAAEKRS